MDSTPLAPTTLPHQPSTAQAQPLILPSATPRVGRDGCCPPRPALSGAQNSLEGLQVRRAEGCYRPAESLLPTGLPRQQPSLISVPSWKHGLREALATERYPASEGCCSGWARGAHPQHCRTLRVTQFLAQPQGGHRMLHPDSPGAWENHRSAGDTRDCQQIWQPPLSG